MDNKNFEESCEGQGRTSFPLQGMELEWFKFTYKKFRVSLHKKDVSAILYFLVKQAWKYCIGKANMSKFLIYVFFNPC